MYGNLFRNGIKRVPYRFSKAFATWGMIGGLVVSGFSANYFELLRVIEFAWCYAFK